MSIRTTVSVSVRDHGWAAIKRDVQTLNGRGVLAGILARDAGKRYPDGTKVIDVAVWNEFGTSTAPSRPFMRHTADTSRSAVAQATANTAQRVILGRADVAQSLAALGAWYADRIKSTILNSVRWAAPNAPSTIARKGSAIPLIDTRLLLRSIDSEVQ